MSDDTQSEIIRATGRALCEHGYADLTMQHIAEESSLTTAAIHYHFDTKEDLLTAFLEDLTERFEARLACDASDPRERLSTLLSAVFSPPEGDDDVPVAMMELRSRAPHHERYRARFRALDETVRTVVESAVRDGVERGYFDEADPAAVSRFVRVAIDGGHARAVGLGEDPERTRQLVERHLSARLGWSPGVVA